MTKRTSRLRFLSMTLVTGALATALVVGIAGYGNQPASVTAQSVSLESGRASAAEMVGVRTQAESLNKDLTGVVAKILPAFVLFPSGSGICISPDGYVLTNHHVASEATRRYTADSAERKVKIPVTLANNGRDFNAIPVGANPRGDVVMVKLELEPGETVPYVNLGDSDQVEVGDAAIVIGNPFLMAGFAFEPSVSFGVVSATGRLQGGYTNTIQIDAALNPGNSGGPLFNYKGEVIGINGRILTSHGARFNTGAGFAIPVNQIKRFMMVWKEREGAAVLSRHGLISGLALTHDNSLGGARVAQVRADSAAASAGIKTGDSIVAVGAKRVRGTAGFYNLIGEYPQDDTVELTIERSSYEGTSTVKVNAVLDAPVELNQALEWPRCADGEEDRFIFQNLRGSAGESLVSRMVNPFGVQPATAALGVSPGHSKGDRLSRGIEIVSFINLGSNAESVLRVGDLLTHVGKVRVRYSANLLDAMLGYRSGDEIPVTVLRDGKPVELTIKAGISARVTQSRGNRRRG